MLSLAKDYIVSISPPPHEELTATFQAIVAGRVLLRPDLVDLLPDMLTVGSPLYSETVRFRLGRIYKSLRGRLPDSETWIVSGSPKSVCMLL